MGVLKFLFKLAAFLVALVVVCGALLVGCGAMLMFTSEEASLEFNLSDEDFEDFKQAAEKFEDSAISGKGAFSLSVNSRRFADGYSKINSQYIIANINYYRDITDEEALRNYEYAFGMRNDASNLYNETLKNILTSDSEYAKELFASWSEDEKNLILNNSEAIYALNEANEKLLIEYRALDNSAEGWIQSVDGIYAQTVNNYNALAKEYGYSNFYEFSSKMQYTRNYTREDRDKLRGYVKSYIVPLYFELGAKFNELYGKADESTLAKFNALMMESYVENDEIQGYVLDYVRDFTEGDALFGMGIGDNMESMLSSELVVFESGENARPGAFTSYLSYYYVPVAYFGPGYQNMLTVIHEMGHYAAFDRLGMMGMPVDFCEVHSQTNEWLFIEFLADRLDPAVYELLELYSLTDVFERIIMSVAVDECEERIYGVGELSVEEIAPIITETLASYGEQVISELNLEKYVRYVAVDNPVYYLSYATSGITSLENYIDAKESSSEARNEYVSFIDSSIDPKRIAEGLRSPFNENTYKRFSETFGVNNADSTENSDGVGASLHFAPLEERVLPAA